MVRKQKRRLVLLTWLLLTIPLAALGQAQYSGQPAQPQPTVPPRQVPGPQQQPTEYAFRPDLTNPEFGQCLNLEKTWRDLWQRYAQGYQQARMMNPSDPRYAQMTYYLGNLKQQLDAAWQNFSGRCVYFPHHR